VMAAYFADVPMKFLREILFSKLPFIPGDVGLALSGHQDEKTIQSPEAKKRHGK